MRIGVISDIHSNFAAFEAVLADMGVVDALWCLGDSVGYGPQPNECLARLEQRGTVVVPGNHDWAAIGRLGVEEFNPDAAAAVQWTSQQLSPGSRRYLGSLALTRVDGDFSLAHGSPREPIWEYVASERVAAENLAHFSTRFCLVGHTHVPAAFIQSLSKDAGGDRVDGAYMADGADLTWSDDGRRYILNPGSVGQPRDNDPRAAYLLLDTDRRHATWRRVSYPIQATQDLMAKYRLPTRLIVRLSHGW